MPPSPFEWATGQPLAQQAVTPAAQHWPLQPAGGPAGQEHAPALQVPPAHGMHAPPQRIWPAGHWHFEALQAMPAGQAMAQPPQWAASLVVSTHADPHCVGKGARHWQVPPAQEEFARTAEQAFPQPPQFAGSVAVFTHAGGDALRHSVPYGATHPQTPAVHASFLSGHGTPQPAGGVPVPDPQFIGSVVVSVQSAPQSSGFAPPQAHAPAWHVEPGFVVVQSVQAAPHAVESVETSRQRGTSASQRLVPAPHWHTPPAQVAPAPQRTPQPPQLFASVW